MRHVVRSLAWTAAAAWLTGCGAAAPPPKAPPAATAPTAKSSPAPSATATATATATAAPTSTALPFAAPTSSASSVPAPTTPATTVTTTAEPAPTTTVTTTPTSPTTPPTTSAASAASTTAPDAKEFEAVPDAKEFEAVPFLPANALGMLHVRVGEVLRLPLVVRLDKEFGATPADADSGWWWLPSLRRAEEAWLGAVPEPFAEWPASPLLVLRYAEPYDLAALLRDSGLKLRVVDEKIAGKAARVVLPAAGKAFATALFQADPKTILIGPEALVRKLATAEPTGGPVAELLAEQPRRAHVRLALVPGTFRPKWTEWAVRLEEEWPFPYDALPKWLPQFESAGAALDLAGKDLLEISLRNGQDETLAGDAEAGLTRAWNEMRAQLVWFKQQGTGTLDKSALTVVDEVRGGLTIGRKGRSVSLRLARPATLEAAVDRFLTESLPKMRAQFAFQAANNLRNVALAVLQYESASGKLPTDYVSPAGKPLLSWRVRILPYLERGDLHRQIKFDEAWDSPHNKPITDAAIKVFASPGVPPGRTAMFVFKGPTTPFPGNGTASSTAGIQDGVAETLMLAIAKADRAVPWAKPADLDFDPRKIALTVAALPEEDVQVVLLNGRVLKWKKLPKVNLLKGLITAAGKDFVDKKLLEAE